MRDQEARKCAVYLRQSLDRDGERLAVTRQREDCFALAQDRGWEIVDEYEDNSVSAYDRSKSRPAYDRMVADFAAGRFDALICWDLDRLTRQPRQLEDWIEAAETRGLLFVTANGEADLSTDGGRMYARIKASVARAEGERKGARQRRAMAQRIERGIVPAGTRLTGYTTKGEVLPEEADLVRSIFDRFAAGESLFSIAGSLSEAGVPPRRSSVWHPSSVRDLLTNARYAGLQVFQGKPTGHRGNWEPLVGEPTFATVQAILTDPRRITNREGTARKHLGSGLFVCDECGEPVRAHSGRYRCRFCEINRTREPIDALVRATVAAWLDSPEIGTLTLTPPQRDDAALDRLSELRSRLASIEGDYDSGLIDGHRYQVASAKVAAELRQAERGLAQSRTGLALATIANVESPGDTFLSAPLDIQRQILSEFMAVRLRRQPRGRKGFNPESVLLKWKGTS